MKEAFWILIVCIIIFLGSQILSDDGLTIKIKINGETHVLQIVAEESK